MTRKVVLAWSGGKDGALALRRLRADPAVQVTGLLTTLVERYDRVQMHGVRRVLVEAQAEALELPLHEVWVPHEAGNAEYERAQLSTLARLRDTGAEAVAFGDLFLQDIRAYREAMLAPTGLAPLFPLWGEDTTRLAQEVIDTGLRATVVCVDPTRVDPELLGRPYDAALLEALPPEVDPCGERGEFHTFVHDGPAFAYPIATVLGVRREWLGQVYRDLLAEARHETRRRPG